MLKSPLSPDENRDFFDTLKYQSINDALVFLRRSDLDRDQRPLAGLIRPPGSLGEEQESLFTR